MKINHLLTIFTLLILFCFGSCSTNKTQANALSFDSAIKVNSVDEEYKYVKEHCQDCKFIGQSLRENKGKYYDILELEKANGEKVSYYFNITSFYGKW